MKITSRNPHSSLVRVDVDGRLRKWDKVFSSQISLSDQQLFARSIDDLFTVDGAGSIAALVAKCAQNDGKRSFMVHSRHNAELTYTVTLQWVDAKNAYCQMLLTPHQAKPVEQGHQTNTQDKQFASSSIEHDRAHLLAAISHKLRTPVNGLLAVTELLNETPLTREQAKYIDLLSEAGRELTALATRIQQLSQIVTGKETKQAHAVDVGALMHDCIADHRESADAKKLSLSYFQADKMPVQMQLAESHVRQILDILVANAVRHTSKGYIRVSADFLDDQLVLRVADSGVGMEQQALHELFGINLEKGEDYRAYHATGFGLILVHRLVQFLGGSIDVESKPGNGSRFTVRLPATMVSSSPVTDTVKYKPASQDTKNEALPKRVLDVLVAEDNPVNQNLFKALLEREGHHVTLVDNGQEAVKKVQLGKRFDVIIMDITMPIMSGMEATAMIRSLHGPVGETPILALTAHAMRGDRERFLDAGMNAYLSKPVNPATLAQTVAALAEKEKANVVPQKNSQAAAHSSSKSSLV